MLVTAVQSAAASAMTVVVVTEPITVLEAGVHPRMVLIWAGWWLQCNLAFVHSGITSPLGPSVGSDALVLVLSHTSSDRDTAETGGSQELGYCGAVEGIHNGS